MPVRPGKFPAAAGTRGNESFALQGTIESDLTIAGGQGQLRQILGRLDAGLLHVAGPVGQLAHLFVDAGCEIAEHGLRVHAEEDGKSQQRRGDRQLAGVIG